MDYKIPKTMEKEHEELHAELREAMKAGGTTGKTAKRLAGVVHPQFVKEEDFALPPLGLLPSLSKGKVTSDMKDILLMTDKLKARALRTSHRNNERRRLRFEWHARSQNRH